MLDRTDHNRLAEATQRHFGIGGNGPPSLIDLAREAMTAVGAFLKDHPTIATEEDARAAKLMKDRADGTIKDMEDERGGLVRPLNTQVAEINGRYRAIRDPFTKTLAFYSLVDRSNKWRWHVRFWPPWGVNCLRGLH